MCKAYYHRQPYGVQTATALQRLAHDHNRVWVQDPLIQNAAFQDLCFLAEASGPAAWRRKLVFDKDNGETWQQLSTVCVDEVSIHTEQAESCFIVCHLSFVCRVQGLAFMDIEEVHFSMLRLWRSRHCHLLACG